MDSALETEQLGGIASKVLMAFLSKIPVDEQGLRIGYEDKFQSSQWCSSCGDKILGYHIITQERTAQYICFSCCNLPLKHDSQVY
ncbi:hypothetical protein HOD38_06165 [archaeon]|jgi:hypothetical protein|nr:hypothetical protein [archaeon]MBT4397822.1 hypothetical protein [archaeon]MBT4441156.1 hypothetical protein [archaeon]